MLLEILAAFQLAKNEKKRNKVFIIIALTDAVKKRKKTPYFFFFHFRSEEHTSELQSHNDLVCRLLLEKKNYIVPTINLASYAELVPGNGVYFTELEIEDRSWRAVTTVGYRPTFGQDSFSMSTHILDFQ